MPKYDDASWHYIGNYPKDLPKENAATHIGMYLTWIIDNNLISQYLVEEFVQDLIKVKDGKLKGSEFLIKNCDGKLTDEDLNDEANEFAKDYYEEDTDFTKQYSSYFKDYGELFGYLSQQENKKYESLYHIEDTWENYEDLKWLIDQRYSEWKQFKSSQSSR